jgi:adenosylcobinamide-phosphate synthase
MSFLAVFFALLLEQVRPLAHENPAHGVARLWAREVVRNLDAGRHSHALLVWGVAVLAPTLGVWAVYLGLLYVHVLLAFAWVVLVLYLTLGFRQFSHHFTEVRDALEAGDEASARQALARWKLVRVEELPGGELVRHAVEHSVISAHRHVFGVLGWFCVLAALGLGPAGAVFYRLSEYVARHWERHSLERQAAVPSAAAALPLTPTSTPVRRLARQMWHAVDYLPARVSALGLAVVGSFEDAIDCWRNYTQRLEEGGRAENDAVILAATAGAMGVRLGGDALKSAFDASASQTFSSEAAKADAAEGKVTPGQDPQVPHLRSLVGLIWRCVVLWMLILALMTLARLTG